MLTARLERFSTVGLDGDSESRRFVRLKRPDVGRAVSCSPPRSDLQGRDDMRKLLHWTRSQRRDWSLVAGKTRHTPPPQPPVPPPPATTPPPRRPRRPRRSPRPRRPRRRRRPTRTSRRSRRSARRSAPTTSTALTAALHAGRGLQVRRHAGHRRGQVHRRTRRTHCASFPDSKGAARRIFVKNDVAIIEWTMTGTNTGPGADGKAKSTGKPVGINGLPIVWFTPDGLIKEQHEYLDVPTMMGQLGMGPKGMKTRAAGDAPGREARRARLEEHARRGQERRGRRGRAEDVRDARRQVVRRREHGRRRVGRLGRPRADERQEGDDASIST